MLLKHIAGRCQQATLAALALPKAAQSNLQRADKALHRAGVARFASSPTSSHRFPPTTGGVSGPTTLDTRQGRVKLSGNDLTSLHSSSETGASLRGLPTILLNDSGSSGSGSARLKRVRKSFIEYFHKTFTMSEKLHEMFTTTSAFYEKHERLRHPPIFYVGHTACFYVNKLHLGKFIERRIDPMLEMQMAVGVDEMSWDDLDSNSYVWPSGAEAREDPKRATAFLQKLLDFRREVRELVDDMMRTQPIEFPIKKDSFWYVILMGIEHERIHLETSSVIHRQADLSSVQPIATFPLCEHGRFNKSPASAAANSIPPNRLIPVKTGTTRIGRSWDGTKTYGWDNEFGKESHLEVPAFAASEFLVSNKEFLDFVAAGGYSNPQFWSEEGWKWASDMKPEAPRFWRKYGNDYHLRTLYLEVPMPWDWPVEVCHHEAAAFCKFLSQKTGKSLRLPMEDEYYRLRDSIPTDLQDSAHGPAWGDKVPGNVNLAYWGSPCPIDMFPSPSGVYDVLGNVWQHCATHLDVLEGFQTHPLYEDFTVPTVGGMHSRIMGGSWISTGACGATRDSRYGFRRHFYQHAGFRYIESSREVVNRASPYESDRQLCDDFQFHFDEPPSGKCFHVSLAEACVSLMQKLGRRVDHARALELGCGPGRSVLELAKHGFAVAHGGDRTAKAFQCTAQRVMVDGGQLRWTNYMEGDHIEKRELNAVELGLGSSVRKEAVQFFQMPDFAEVDTQKFRDYDIVVCAQPGALGRSDPLGTLCAVHGLLKPGGLLVVGTQYEWPCSAAIVHTTAVFSGEDVVAAVLQPWFQPAAESVDLAYIKMETARKLECGLQHLTFWERRATPETGSQITKPLAGGCTSELIPSSIGQAMYDEDVTVGQYLDFHYGPKSQYPQACAELCISTVKSLGVPLGRALEVGSGPGRAAVELSKAFEHVDGGDCSKRFVELGQRLVQDGELRWRCLTDRTAGTTVERMVSASELHVGKVSFSYLDEQILPKELTGYDLICGFNLIDRLKQPKGFLAEARLRLNLGGLLILSSPYDWLEEFTDKDDWLGGFKYGDNDGPTSYEGLKESLLSQGFVEAREPEDVSFCMEELDNGRKSQLLRAQFTFWSLTGE